MAMRLNASVTLFALVSVGVSLNAWPEDQIPEPSFQEQWEACVQQCKLRISPPNGKLRLLSGPDGTKADPHSGHYFRMGKAIAEVMRSGRSGTTNLEIENIPTCQTKCNLWGLQSGHAELALVQSDVAHDAWYGHPPISPTPLKHIKLVAQLYKESVHVLVRPHLNIARLTDLRGRRVWLGLKNSFTVFTARRILDAAGLLTKEINALEGGCADASLTDTHATCQTISDIHTSKEALEKLANLELDAVFQVGVLPFDSVRDALMPLREQNIEKNEDPCSALRRARAKDIEFADSEIRLFNLDVDLVQRLVADGSYIEQWIPADVYCQRGPTLTVSVRALLLTKTDTDAPELSSKTNLDVSDQVRRLSTKLLRHPEAFETNVLSQVTKERDEHGDPGNGFRADLSLLRMDLPESFRRWEIEHEPIFRLPWVTPEVPCLVLGVILLLVLAVLFRDGLGPLLAKRGEFVAGVFGLPLAWIGAALLLNSLEGSVNEHYASFPDAMLTTLVDLSPFGSSHPVTPDGQTWWSVCKWTGLAIFVSIFLPSIRSLLAPWLSKKVKVVKGWLLAFGGKRTAASALVLDLSRKVKALLGVDRKPTAASTAWAKQGHAVIINNRPGLTEELINSLQRAGGDARRVVVISEKRAEFANKSGDADVQEVHGEPTCEGCLREARVSEARLIAIISAWPNPNSPPDRRKFLRDDLADQRTIQAVRTIRTICSPSESAKIRAELQSRENARTAEEAAQGMPIEFIYREICRRHRPEPG